MQQEWLLGEVMTSRRRFQTGVSRKCFLALAAFALMASGCSTLPEDAPVLEKLDTDTGTTIAGIGRPIELYREVSKLSLTDRFAFLAPFETNVMGERKSYLWIAIPVERAVDTALPTLDVNGSTVALGTGSRDPSFANLAKSPYKPPTPWSATYYFTLDADKVAQLGAAETITLKLPDAENEALFTVKIAGDERLRAYAARP
jgi:hypothetical protein